MRPIIVIILVLDQDSTLFFVPQYIMAVTGFTGINAYQTMVNTIFTKRFNHVSSCIIATNIRYKSRIKPQASKSHSGIGRVSNCMQDFGVIKRELGTKLHGYPLAMLVTVSMRLI